MRIAKKKRQRKFKKKKKQNKKIFKKTREQCGEKMWKASKQIQRHHQKDLFLGCFLIFFDILFRMEGTGCDKISGFWTGTKKKIEF